MARNKNKKRTNDLLQVCVIIAILMSFAGYEAQQKNISKSVDKSREFSKSSSDNQPKSQKDTICFTKISL